jgi:long-chain fatty acid transport protein
MVLSRIITVTIIAFLIGLSSQNTFASGSGAYRVETPDAGAMGMGSAFVGEADTPAAVYYNPAGINQITSPEVSEGISIIAPRGQYKSSVDGHVVHEQNNEYNIPNFYAVVPIISNKLTLGVGSGSNWGLGTNWGLNNSLQFATTQASITNVDNSIVAAYQVTPQWSLAASADNDYSRVDESYNFTNFGLTSNGGLQLKGHDDAWGYRLATMFKINDQNQVGLMYRSRINHTYRGTVAVDNIGSAYSGLGLGSSFSTAVREKSVLPQSIVMGYSFKPTRKWTINLDVEWMDWSSVKSINLSFPNATANQLQFLGSGVTQEEWQAAWSESIGTQYAITDKFRVRAGYYHHGQVIPNVNFNPVIPDSSSNAFTTGFGYDITKRLTIDVAYSGLFYDTRNVNNAVSSGAISNNTGSVNGKYNQYVHIGLVSLTYKF